MSNELTVTKPNVCIKQLAEKYGGTAINEANRCKAIWRHGDDYSVQYNPDTNTLHDYKEGETYNPYTFLTRALGWSNARATELLASGDVPKHSPSRSPSPSKRSTIVARKTDEGSKASPFELYRPQYEAAKILDGSSPPYLERKRVLPFFETHTLEHKYINGYRGHPHLGIPRRNITGELTAFERIHDDGTKRLLGSPSSSFVVLYPHSLEHDFGAGRLPAPLPNAARMAALLASGYEIGICEGAATGMSVCMAKPKLIMFCAGSNGNVPSVVVALRGRYGYYRSVKGYGRVAINITIWADDDRLTGNDKTLQVVHEVALRYQCKVILPDFSGMDLNAKPTDFNDVLVAKGVKHLANSIRLAKSDELDLGFIAKRPNYSTQRDIALDILDDVDLANKIIAIKSPMGTGKTKLLESVLKNTGSTGSSVLVIGHRKSLLKALSKRLYLDYYEDMPSWSTLRIRPKLAITFDSLHKLSRDDGTLPHFDVIIIDESEQVLSHVTSEHIERNKIASFDVLRRCLESCRAVFCADAHLGTVTTSTMCELAPNKTLHRIEHSYKTGDGKRLTLLQHHSDVVFRALKDLKDGEKVFIVTDSIKTTRALEAMTKNRGMRVLAINSETTGESDVSTYVANPSDTARLYGTVIASPSAQTGLSDESGHWNVVYGLFENTFITSKETMQAISRARGCSDVKIWIDHKIISTRDAKSYRDEHAARARNEQNIVYDDQYLTLKSRVDEQISLDRHNLRYDVAKEAFLLGYDVSVEPLTSLNAKTAKLYDELEAQMKDTERQIHANERANADGSSPRGKAGLLARHRAEHISSYALPSDIDTATLAQSIYDDNHGKQLAALRLYEVGLGITDITKSTTDEARPIGDVQPLTVQQGVYRALYTLAGLSLDTETMLVARHSETESKSTEFVARKEQLEDEMTKHYRTTKAYRDIKAELQALTAQIEALSSPIEAGLTVIDASRVKASEFYRLVSSERDALGADSAKLLDKPILLFKHWLSHTGLGLIEVARGSSKDGVRNRQYRVDEQAIRANATLSYPRRASFIGSIESDKDEFITKAPIEPLDSCLTVQNEQENATLSPETVAVELEPEPILNPETVKEQGNGYSLHTVNNHDELNSLLAKYGGYKYFANICEVENGEVVKCVEICEKDHTSKATIGSSRMQEAFKRKNSIQVAIGC